MNDEYNDNIYFYFFDKLLIMNKNVLRNLLTIDEKIVII